MLAFTLQEHKTIAEKIRGYIYCSLFLVVLFILVSCNSYPNHVIFLYEVDDYPAYHLIWSPTGKYLAFTSGATTLNASAIYILDIEAKEAERVISTDNGHLEAVAWTPDENELMFVAAASEEYGDGIWTITIDNQGDPRLYSDEQVAFGWSFTNQIVIGRWDQAGNLSLHFQNLSTKQEKTISLDHGGSLGSFSWSADGKKLTFSLDFGEIRRRDIFIVNYDAQTTKQITNSGTNDFPSLSPNGKMVAYKKGDFSGSLPVYSLHIMNSDGTCDIEAPGLANIGSPAWSPDGRWIAFVGKSNRIYLFEVTSAFGDEFLIEGLSCN